MKDASAGASVGASAPRPEPGAAPVLLEVRDLEVGYGPVQVVWGVSFRVREGEIVTLVGPNGAGKTTVLRALSGVREVRRGSVLFRGQSLVGLSPRAIVERGVVHVPEGRQLWPRMTVEENLLMGAYLPASRARARERLELVYGLFPRLKERRWQLAGTLSGGEQQMCALGRGLMAEPRLLLLDEPSLGLAPLVVEELFERIVEAPRQGVTVLLVEQNVQLALEIASRGYVMETGRIVLEGPARQLLHDDHVRRSYLGVA